MPTCAPNAVEKLASTEMWSVMSVELTLSIPSPPYSSGTSTAVNPSSAALRSIAAIAPGSLASIAGTRGRISSLANRSAVAAICRCSSFRSSGVKISSGVRDSTRSCRPQRRQWEMRQQRSAQRPPCDACLTGQPDAPTLLERLGSLQPVVHTRNHRVASNRNHARRSASSIQTSIILVVA